MTISLTPHLDQYVRRKLKSGGYASASEIIREALCIMERVEKREPADLEELIAEADAEPSAPMSDRDWNEVRRQVFGRIRKKAA